ncbi:MAG: alpha-L-arabinofuranosidase, partial [Bacteroidaceae bacterium]|nr:alpha-L-arabinofuranosidase [Bacteroidaceae bacterium]
MKKTLLAGLWMVASAAMAGVPDSVYVRPTALPRGGGLRIEWSADGYRWTSATEGRVLGSDFGAWGAEKKLLAPSIVKGDDGQMVCVFQVNDRTNQFGVTTTRDFVRWRPQDYPYMNGVGECLEPIVSYVQGIYTVTFHNKSNQCFRTTSRDLTHFSDPVATETPNAPKTLRVPYSAIENLRNKQLASQKKGELEGELARDNATRFAGLKEVQAEVRVSARNPKAISDKLMGIFFEDINYAADGGLNAQLVQNGDFEYDTHDRKGDVNWNSLTAWEKSNGLIVTATDGVSPNNSHAFAISGKGEYLANKGWDGIALKAGERYNLSMYVKDGAVKATLVEGGKVVGETTISGGKQWKLAKAVIRANANTKRAELRLQPVGLDCVSIDMVSLLPQDTYKGHGLRKDLAQALADLKPAFMRFPGGCVAHGDGIGNIYNWKETIGDLKDRKPARNLWGYHQSRQIGYYEFFQLCEDMGMEPLPVLAAGVPCQNSSDGAHGQQGGIPMEDMPDYIQDSLDLIE